MYTPFFSTATPLQNCKRSIGEKTGLHPGHRSSAMDVVIGSICDAVDRPASESLQYRSRAVHERYIV